jgi:predicted O-linked N-acetylglucosamine transferase (SPINDLY family)
MRNYREQPLAESRAAAERYAKFWDVTPYAHDQVAKRPDKKLRIGYLSPDFREHAVASFLSPLLKHFDGSRFMVYCYATGKRDEVTRRLQSRAVTWRDLRGRSPKTAARLIAEDQIDILVDLSGHTQDSCLPIMAYRPAPVQLAGIGYMNTTGCRPSIIFCLMRPACRPGWCGGRVHGADHPSATFASVLCTGNRT